MTLEHSDFGVLPSSWSVLTLGDVADVTKLAGFEFTKHIEYLEDGEIIALRSLNVCDGQLDLSKVKRISIDASNALPRSKLFVGDLLLTYTGSKLGDTAIIDSDDRYHLAPNVCRLRAHNNEDAYYLYLFMRSAAFARILDNFKVGSGQPTVPMKNIRKIPIPWPNEAERSLVCQIYKSLNNKSVTNVKLNQILEEMAQTIFKSWFVDFDPVKAKMNGEQPEGMDEATASLFPEKLVETELGLIPEGWHIQNTQDLFEVRDGTHDSPKKAENGYYLVTSKHITKGKIDTSSAYLISELDFEQVNQRSKVDTFDILLTMIGTVGEVVVVYDNPVEFAIKNVGLFKTSQKPELVWLFYWHLQSFKMKNYLEVRMAGTTQQYLTLKTLRTIPVLVPSQNLLQKFNELISPLMGKISDNHNQNQSLSELRDTLLPKLLSGEIDLAETTI